MFPVLPSIPALRGRAGPYSAAGCFFLLGGALNAAAAIIFQDSLPPPPPGQGPSSIWTVAFTCAGVGALVGIVLLIGRNRLTERYANYLPFLAVVLLAVPMLWSRIVTPTGAILMLWPVLYASSLLTEPITWATTFAGVIVLFAGSFVDPHLGLLAYSPMIATLVLTGYVIITLQRRVHVLLAELGRQASTDPLTGLANRRTLIDTLRREVAEHQRREALLCVLMIDVDRFKRLNDSAGHDAGDEALRRLARTLQRQTRAGDLTARFGGEEFTAIMVDCALDDAARRADELRARIESDSREWPHVLTVSIGVAELAPGTPDEISALITNADNALYKAKRRGRNRVEQHVPGESPGPRA